MALPDDRGRPGRRADRDRAGDGAPVRVRQERGRVLRLPRLPPRGRERQLRAGPGPDRHRRSSSEPRRSGARCSTRRRRCRRTAGSRRRTPSSSTSSSRTSHRSGNAVSAGGDAAAGTLPETQVRAMFDRIAGVYDAMNSVMTVGMHHRWRERAADLARLSPGDSALDVATGTGDLAIELTPPRGPVRPRRRVGLLGGHARPGARQERGRRVGVGRRARPEVRRRLVRRRDRRLRRPQLLRPRRRPARDGARRAARRARRRAGDHHPAEAAAVVLLPGVVRHDRARPGARGGRRRRLHLPAVVGAAVPRAAGPRRLARRRRACATSAGS